MPLGLEPFSLWLGFMQSFKNVEYLYPKVGASFTNSLIATWKQAYKWVSKKIPTKNSNLIIFFLNQVIDQLFSRDTSKIDWEFIHGLFANAIYGGRIDDVFDIQVYGTFSCSL